MTRFFMPLFLLLYLLPCCASPTRYRITPLPGMDVGVNGDGASINSQGKIVSGDMLWDKGKHQTLSIPLPRSQYQYIVVRSINDKGMVAGDASGATDGAWLANFGQAMFWRKKRGQELPVHTTMSTSATGINNAGTIIGTAYQPMPAEDQSIYQAFLVRHGRTVFLDASKAICINNQEQVVVQINNPTAPSEVLPHFLLLSHGKRVRIWDALSHIDIDEAKSINDSGTVIGQFSSIACLWRRGSVMRLGKLSGKESVALAINNQNQIIGKADIKPLKQLGQYASPETHAFVWKNGRMTDLNMLIPAHSGWVLTEADAINDRGQIVCAGNKGACLLTPIANKHNRL